MRALRSTRWRFVVVLGALALFAAACPGDDTDDAASPGPDTTPTDGAADGTDEAFSYATGIFEDTTTDNVWAYLGPDSTVWNQYLLEPTAAFLYEYTSPDLELEPYLATADFEPAEEEDGEWVAEAEICDCQWSDGEPITAEDMQFTFETVRDLSLTGNWLVGYPLPSEEDPDAVGITEIEADGQTVRIHFNNEPGFAIWPNAVGTAYIMPKHFWEDTVEEAKDTEDPAETLYAESGEGAPSGGAMIFEAREPGSHAESVANDSFPRAGQMQPVETVEGVDEYEYGPFASDALYSLYGSQDAAVLALREGEVDYLFNPLGMQRGLREQVTGDENLTAVTNPTNGYRYLAFNMRKSPMNIKEFRQALAIMIDKEFMAESVLQGVAFPLNTHVPPGNEAWYDEETATALYEPYTGHETEGDKVEAATELLREAGFTWDQEPTVEREEDEETGEVTETINAGDGIRTPDGELVPELELLAPGPGYDPLRATYSTWIDQWANQLGIPVSANPTNFNVIVEEVFPQGTEPEFDMYILGWSLTIFPDHYDSFFASDKKVEDGGNNAPGFENETFDQLVNELLTAPTEEEARQVIWGDGDSENSLEGILADELPYIVLFDTPILEFYRDASVNYPYTTALGGLQFWSGLVDQVRTAR